jgi:hypothetical protein
VIGAWTRQPPGPIDPARVEAAVAELAAPSPAAADGPLRPAHHVAITVTPPIGAAQVHALELGAAPPTGCGARVAAEIVALPAGLCREIAALAK